MGSHVSNDQSHQLDREGLLVLHYDIETQTLEQFWELICETI